MGMTWRTNKCVCVCVNVCVGACVSACLCGCVCVSRPVKIKATIRDSQENLFKYYLVPSIGTTCNILQMDRDPLASRRSARLV